jgi:glycine/D-amino acid oxidase-like deaminating enzyme
MSTSVPDTAIGAVYSADDAQVNTAKFSRVLADACRRSGVRVYENTAALRLIRHAGAVIGVRTVRGDVMAEGVVWSTGAWAVNLESEGISLPVTPVRVGMLVTQPVTERSTVITHGPHGAENCTALMDLPGFRAEDFSPEVTTGVSDLTYEDVVAQNAEGSIMIGHTYEAAQSLNPHVTLDATQMMVQTIRHRRPDFGRLGVTGLWAGLVGVTPDALPIITKTDGLFVNTGHSLCTASGPPSGELMAQLVAGEEPSIDLSAFALDRPSLAGPATS